LNFQKFVYFKFLRSRLIYWEMLVNAGKKNFPDFLKNSKKFTIIKDNTMNIKDNT
jgi:hypothetical protein